MAERRIPAIKPGKIRTCLLYTSFSLFVEPNTERTRRGELKALRERKALRILAKIGDGILCSPLLFLYVFRIGDGPAGNRHGGNRLEIQGAAANRHHWSGDTVGKFIEGRYGRFSRIARHFIRVWRCIVAGMGSAVRTGWWLGA